MELFKKTAALPVGSKVDLTLTIAVRNSTGSPVFSGPPTPTATVDGITHTIEGSSDSVFPSSPVSEITPPAGLAALPSGWEYRRFRLDDSGVSINKGFLRVKVTQETIPAQNK